MGQPQPASEPARHAGRVSRDTRQTVAARHRGKGETANEILKQFVMSRDLECNSNLHSAHSLRRFALSLKLIMVIGYEVGMKI